MPFVYTMTAEENYTPVITAQWTAATQPNYCFCDKQYIGTSFDRERRNIMYSATITTHTQDAAGLVTQANATGKTLWNSLGATPNGNTLDLGREFVFQTAIKNIDSAVVTYYPSYDPNQVVPSGKGAGGITSFTITAGSGTQNGTFEGQFASGGSGDGARATVTFTGGQLTAVTLWGIGYNYVVNDVLTFPVSGSTGSITVTSVNTGSDGTWGRSVGDTTLEGGNVLAITDPRTGNFWVHMQSCELHVFRPSKNFAMEISPLQLPFTIAQNKQAEGAPIGVTANWVYFWAARQTALNTFTNVMQILPATITAGEITSDQLLATYTYNYPDNTYCFRQIVGSDANLYVFGQKISGTRAYKLWNCVPGTGFTDITPWAGGTGPNSDVAGWTSNGTDVGTNRNYVIQLPATKQLALISKMLPADWSTPGTDPTKFRIDCTYYDIGNATFDYHESMVYGYMDANWNVTNLAGAAYQVLDFNEFDNDLECSDFLHPNVDYTTRRFMFICYAMSGGVAVDNNRMAVFVDYQFVYGKAPGVVQIVSEVGWDNTYTAYSNLLIENEVIAGSLPVLSQTNNASYKAFATNDNYIWDRLNGNLMWLSGDDPIFCKFDSRYTGRYTQALKSWGVATSAASSPFMKLNFSDPARYCVPIVIGSTYVSKGQILRPATPQESQTQSGPSQGKKRRMTYAAPLLVDTQGISMGVDFMKMRALELESPGGTVDLTLQQTFSGVYWGTVDATFNYDNMWCWQITRPYPATVVSVECQLEVNENL